MLTDTENTMRIWEEPPVTNEAMNALKELYFATGDTKRMGVPYQKVRLALGSLSLLLRSIFHMGWFFSPEIAQAMQEKFRQADPAFANDPDPEPKEGDIDESNM